MKSCGFEEKQSKLGLKSREMTPTLKAFHGTWASKGNDNSVFPQTFQICWAYSKLAMLWNDLSFSDPCHDIKRSVRSRSAGWNENDIVRWGWLMKITTFPCRSDLECYEPPLRISWQLWNSWCGWKSNKDKKEEILKTASCIFPASASLEFRWRR